MPDDIDEPDEANKDYEYMVTMMVGDVAQDSADITVTVLEKPNISCSNTSIAFLRGIAQYGAFARRNPDDDSLLRRIQGCS